MTRTGVLITGSRTWPDRQFIWNVLTELRNNVGDLIVFHGACPTGTDFHAAAWVREPANDGSAERGFPADWIRHGKAAGPIRNSDMVRAFVRDGHRYAFAFRQGGTTSRGTANCLQVMRRATLAPVVFDFEEIYSR